MKNTIIITICMFISFSTILLSQSNIDNCKDDIFCKMKTLCFDDIRNFHTQKLNKTSLTLSQKTTHHIGLGDMFFINNNLQNAEEQYIKARSLYKGYIRRKEENNSVVSQSDYTNLSHVHLRLAYIYVLKGNDKKAGKELNETRRAFKKAGITNSMLIAYTLESSVDYSSGHYFKAMNGLNQWIIENDSTKHPKELFYSNIFLGMMQHSLAPLKTTQTFSRAREKIEQPIEARNKIIIASMYTHQAVGLFIEGKYEEAAKNGLVAVSILENTLKNNNLGAYDLILTHSVLNNIYDKLGDYNTSLGHCKAALDLMEDGEFSTNRDKAYIYSKLYKLATKADRFKDAHNYYEKAKNEIDSLGFQDLLKIKLLENKAEYYVTIERLNEAEKILDSIELIIKINPSLKKVKSHKLTWGKLHLKTKNFSEAKRNLMMYKRFLTSKGNEDKNQLMKTYYELGNLTLEQKNITLANKYYKEALKLSEETHTPLQEALVLYQLGELHFSQNNITEALDFFEKSIEETINHLDELGEKYSRRYSIEYNYKAFQKAIECSSILYENTNNKKYLGKIFIISEKYRTYNDKRSSSRNNINKTNNDSDLASLYSKEKVLNNKLNTYNLRERKDTFDYQTFILDKRLIASQINNLEQRGNNKKLCRNSKNIEDVQKYLKKHKNSAVLDYIYMDAYLYILLISYKDVELIKLDNISIIEKNIDKFRKLIDDVAQQKGDLNEVIGSNLIFLETIRPLYQFLFEAVKNSDIVKTEKIEHFCIIPDGKLHYLPFEILFSDKSEKKYKDYKYVVQEFDITYATSVTNLLELEERREKQKQYSKKTLGVGVNKTTSIVNLFNSSNINFKNLTFHNKTRISLYSYHQPLNQLRSNLKLPIHTGNEMQALLEYSSSQYTTILEGNEATEYLFKGKLDSRYQIVHIACHGVLNDSLPELSYLLLGKDIIHNSDGRLYVFEIDMLTVNVDLMILSACNTRVGEIVKGEGMVSFMNSFQEAGASTIISSLWKIEDNATSQLFEYFYEYLNNPKYTKYDALKEAQLQMIKDGKTPYEWAGLVLNGLID